MKRQQRINDILKAQIRAFKHTFHTPPPELTLSPSEIDRLVKRLNHTVDTFDDTPISPGELDPAHTVDATPRYWNLSSSGNIPDPTNFNRLCVQPARRPKTPEPCPPTEAEFWVIYGITPEGALQPLHYTANSTTAYLIAETLSRRHNIPIEPTLLPK